MATFKEPKPTKADIERVRALFKKAKKTLWLSDVSRKLDMDLQITVGACKILMKEGVIAVDKRAK